MSSDFPSQSILRQLLLGKSREEIAQQFASQRNQTRWSESSSPQSSSSQLSNLNQETTGVSNCTLFGGSMSHTGPAQLNSSSAHAGYSESASANSSSFQPNGNSYQESVMGVPHANSTEGSMSHTGLMPFMSSSAQPGWPEMNCIQGVVGPPISFTDLLQFNQSSNSSNLTGGNHNQSFQRFSSFPYAILATPPSHLGAAANMIPETYPGSSQGQNIPTNIEVAMYYCLATKLFYSLNN